MNSFEINKIITAILVTVLVVFGIGKISDIFPIPKTINIVTKIAVIILFISKEFIYIIYYNSYNMIVIKKLKYLNIQFASLGRINYQEI